MSKTALWITVSLFLLLLSLTGCQTRGTSSDVLLLSYGMEVGKVSTDTHEHFIISHKLPEGSHSLHVYIEGDGTPWLKRFWVARDPSPRNPLALQLMKRDQGSDRIYLGRPCYFNNPRFGLSDKNCHPALWTSHRYSEEVVASMTAALQLAVDLNRYQKVVLVGHSGGGTLATLIAHRLNQPVSLITLGANLDIQAWTRHHNYSPLTGSLNPAEVVQKSALVQVHFYGRKDETVPPSLNHSFLTGIGHEPRIIDNYDHTCCWLKAWPELLSETLTQWEKAQDLTR